jgi:hypothetical protein
MQLSRRVTPQQLRRVYRGCHDLPEPGIFHQSPGSSAGIGEISPVWGFKSPLGHSNAGNFPQNGHYSDTLADRPCAAASTCQAASRGRQP